MLEKYCGNTCSIISDDSCFFVFWVLYKFLIIFGYFFYLGILDKGENALIEIKSEILPL